MKSVLSLVVVAAAFAGLVEARQSNARAEAEKLDFAAIGRVRDEGLARSQVMDHIFWLADVYGPRLTGSPGIQQASEWAMNKFKEWGLSQRPSGAMEVRQGLVTRPLQREPRRAAGAADHRLSRNPGPPAPTARSSPTSSARRSRTRTTLRSIAARSPARSSWRSRRESCGCSKDRSSCAWTTSGRAEAADDTGAAEAAAGGGRGRERGLRAEAARLLPQRGRRRGVRSRRQQRHGRRRQRPDLGSSSIPTAARSFPAAPARATSAPVPACRRSRWRSSTTTGWCACWTGRSR